MNDSNITDLTDIFLRIKKGDAIKCHGQHCNETFCVYNHGDLKSMRCAKCIGNWIKPGKHVPALSYTSCVKCECQFMVEKPYNGKNPFCPKCRPLKVDPNLKYCGYCKSHKGDVTYGVHPYNHELYDDNTKVWMCKNCRYESYMDV